MPRVRESCNGGPDFANLYMPFEAMLFFADADAGNGDQFAFVIRDRPADVFVWDHETDSRTKPSHLPRMMARRPAEHLMGANSGRSGCLIKPACASGCASYGTGWS